MTNSPETPNYAEQLTFLNPELEQLSLLDMNNGKAESSEAAKIATTLNREAREADADFTVMNPDIGISTVLNPRLSAQKRPLEETGAVQILCPASPAPDIDDISAETLLCGHWRVEKRLPGQSGEAVLYACSWDGAEEANPESGKGKADKPSLEKGACVAKVYRRSSSIKREVLDKLSEIRSPYVAPLYAYGEWAGRAVTILPRFMRGSLQGVTVPYETLKSRVIPCLNEGLNALHNAGILHKDLKPSNIMRIDEAGNVAIIDFGISSAFEGENTVMITRTGMTPAYSAPEMFRGVAARESDYYSMGVTLYELFSGSVPYAGMSGEEIAQFLSIQRFPLPDDMPKDLQDLIRGLTYPDISGRQEEDNPNRRWGYEEVKKWLSGIKQPVPGAKDVEAEPYRFCGKEYDSRAKLAEALISNWEEGKKHLFTGQLSAWFRQRDSAAFEICRQAEERRSSSGLSDDRIFWEAVWDLSPRRKDFFWKGAVYAGLPHFGEALLEGLRTENQETLSFAGSVLEEGVLSRYVERLNFGDRAREDVAALEQAHRTFRERRDKTVNYYKMGFLLSGQKTLRLAGREFRTVKELTEFLRKLSEGSGDAFQRVRTFCYEMVDRDNQMDAQLEAWLWRHGKENALSNWRNKMSEMR